MIDWLFLFQAAKLLTSGHQKDMKIFCPISLTKFIISQGNSSYGNANISDKHLYSKAQEVILKYLGEKVGHSIDHNLEGLIEPVIHSKCPLYRESPENIKRLINILEQIDLPLYPILEGVKFETDPLLTNYMRVLSIVTGLIRSYEFMDITLMQEIAQEYADLIKHCYNNSEMIDSFEAAIKHTPLTRQIKFIRLLKCFTKTRVNSDALQILSKAQDPIQFLEYLMTLQLRSVEPFP